MANEPNKPDFSNVKGGAGTTAPKADFGNVSSGSASTPGVDAPAARTYTVVSGDSLSGNVKLGAFGSAPLTGVRV